MIILSGVLVVVAIGLLVAGIVAGNGEGAEVLGLEALTVIYISIAVSIVSALCLAVGVFLRRKELFGAASGTKAPSAKSKPGRKAKRDRKADRAVPAAAPAPAKDGQTVTQEAKKDTAVVGPVDDQPTIPAQPADVPEDALVYVVRGRKRYHLETCRQLAGKDKEDLTYVEAKEEGFSPCTACMPDTALAARAAVVSAAPAAAKPAGAGRGGRPAEKKAAQPNLGKPKPAAPPASTASAAPQPAPAKPAQPADTKPPTPAAWPSTPAAPTVTDQPLPTPAPAAPPAPAPKPEPAKPESAKPESAKPESAKPEPAKPEPVKPQADAPPAVVQSAAASPSAPRPRQGQGQTATETGSADPQVRILSGTKRYHRSDCALIEDIGDEADDLEALPRTEAKARGCTPCLVCQPDKEHARD